MSGKKLADEVSVRVVFEPDGGGWHVFAPDVRGCRSWGRSLSEARGHIREALSLCEDVFSDARTAAATVLLEEHIKLPAHLRQAVRRVERARQTAAKARAIEADAARALTETLSLRDAGELLGISQEGVRRLKAG